MQTINYIAYIISWNVWQMDGLKGVVPNSCGERRTIVANLFGTREEVSQCEGCQKDDIRRHNGVYCQIKDWRAKDPETGKMGKRIRFIDLIKLCSMIFTTSLKLKLIYVFRINDAAHRGCLKVGEATCDNDNVFGLAPNSKALNEAAKKRINQYTQTAGIAYDLLYTELTIYNSRKGLCSFNDKEVHSVLERSGIRKKVFDIENKANEWFITDLETVKRAITAVKEGRESLSSAEVSYDQTLIVFRPEQQEAIEKTKKQFRKSNQMLWNAKMRFGKTLSALQVVKDMDFSRTLILTHRPVVDSGWFEDFGKIFYDSPDFADGS